MRRTVDPLIGQHRSELGLCLRPFLLGPVEALPQIVERRALL